MSTSTAIDYRARTLPPRRAEWADGNAPTHLHVKGNSAAHDRDTLRDIREVVSAAMTLLTHRPTQGVTPLWTPAHRAFSKLATTNIGETASAYFSDEAMEVIYAAQDAVIAEAAARQAGTQLPALFGSAALLRSILVRIDTSLQVLTVCAGMKPSKAYRRS